MLARDEDTVNKPEDTALQGKYFRVVVCDVVEGLVILKVPTVGVQL
jgi:hypothetical protein